MNTVRGLVLGLVVALSGAGVVLAQPGAAAPAKAESLDLQKFMDGVAPKLVTIKFILKMEMGGQLGDMGMDAEESEQETAGVMIDAHGLVLTSNAQLGGFADMFAGDSGISATPKDVKVLIGDDTEGLKAEVIARDKELDLAWVRITEVTGADGKPKTFDALDVSNPGTAKVGERVYVVEKLGKYFDRSPIVLEDKIAGFTKKPRTLMVPMGILAPSMGKPVFGADGALLGVIVVQVPGAEEVGGDNGDMRALGMILPAGEIAKATERAIATAAQAAEKPAGATPAAPAKPEEKK